MNSQLLKNYQYMGELTLPGDKSISHRAIIFASIAKGKSILRNLLLSGDTNATIEAFRNMGIEIQINNEDVVIYGKGIKGLNKPKEPIACNNSGTTARLLIGLLTGQNFDSTVVGSQQLNKRPMDRVSTPLKEIGCSVESNNGKLPVTIKPSKINKFVVDTNVSSAQVKSSLMLASMYSEEPVVIIEDKATRDHTEKIMSFLDINLVRMGHTVTVPPVNIIPNFSITVPSDISSAAFLIALGLLTDSSIKLQNVLVNESRMGFVKSLVQMGAEINIDNISTQFGEQVGDIEITQSNLIGLEIGEDEVPSMIDELPIFALVASQAQGETFVRGVSELRIKESDRLEAINQLFIRLGMTIDICEDGFKIVGPQEIKSGKVKTYGDHRIAMTAIIAALVANKKVEPDNVLCIEDSYPSFFNDLQYLGVDSL